MLKKRKLYLKTSQACFTQISDNQNVKQGILSNLKSSPFFVVSELNSVDKIINSLTQILEGVLQADQQMMEKTKTKAKVFSALITVLQMKEMKGELTQGRLSRSELSL